MRERILVLGREVRDDIANALSAQLLLLSAAAPEKDIWLYINSGGSATAGLAIYDTMRYVRYVRYDVATVAMGLVAAPEW
jgi:ATP-dependent Clp protease, protease subunit